MKIFFKIKSIELNPNEAVVSVSASDIDIWCLEVARLVEGSADSLTIATHKGDKKITIKLGGKDADKSKNMCQRVNGKGLEFSLPLNQSEYLLATLDQIKRDGAADVNHIHLEGIQDERSFDLTFFFDNVKKPLSPEEAAKLLKD